MLVTTFNKKQAGAELKKKKRIFGTKIGEKFENKVQKLSNFKGKKDFFGQKKQAGAELKKEKRIFGPNIWKKFKNQVQKLSNFKGKKDFFGPKKKSWG